MFFSCRGSCGFVSSIVLAREVTLGCLCSCVKLELGLNALQRTPNANRLGFWLLYSLLPVGQSPEVALTSGPLPTLLLTNLGYFWYWVKALSRTQMPKAIGEWGGGTSQLSPTAFRTCLWVLLLLCSWALYPSSHHFAEILLHENLLKARLR